MQKKFALLLFCSLSGLLLRGLSQVKESKPNASLSLYREGLAFYNKALQLSSSKHRSETAEDELNKAALIRFVRFIETAQTGSPSPDSLLFSAYVKAGELAHSFDSLPQALRYYNSAVAVKQKQSLLADSALFKPYVLAGVIYYQQNKLDSSIACLKKADSLQNRAAYPLQESGRLYNLLGSIHYEYGNYKLAKNYFQKAAEVVVRLRPDDEVFLDNYKMNLAASLFKLEEYGPAQTIYRSVLAKGGFFLNQIYHNLGQIEMFLGFPHRALYYLQKVRYTNRLSIGLNNNIAGAYLSVKAFDSARKYLALATSENAKYNAQAPSIDYGRTLKLCGDLQRESGRNTEALRFYQQALHHFYPSFTNTDVLSNPVQFSGAFSYINLFQTLAAKAETLEALYRQEKGQDRATQALETYKAAFTLIAYVERTYESDEARLFLAKIKQALHSRPIDLAFERYRQTGDEAYLSLLYTFDQQNKAAVLALNRQLNTALEGNTPPPVQKERDVKSAIARLAIKALQTTDSVQLATLDKNIRDYEIELGELQQNLHAEETVKEAIPPLRSLQDRLLDEKTALVSYHLSPEKLTTLVVTQKAVRCYQQALPPNFTRLVHQAILSLKMPLTKPAQTKTATLYHLLLSNVSLAGKEQVIIIPDDVLSYLPFESLQSSEGKFLIQQAAVQYQFSTALLAKNETDFADAETVSFAPFAKRAYTALLPVLPASARETEGLKGTRFLDTAATKEKFLAVGPSFPIVHLATHAVVNDSADNFSYIAFAPAQTSRDNLLYAQEIYNLRLQQTDLIILSACETSAGSLVKGEGVLSLSRAFAYAGCPNVITSLWKADDFSTAYLTGRIHQYLNKGYSIAKAVQRAKVDYLNDKTLNPRLKHPYYWSHLVFVGAYAPEKNLRRYWIGATALLLLLSFAVYRARFRKAGHHTNRQSAIRNWQG